MTSILEYVYSNKSLQICMEFYLSLEKNKRNNPSNKIKVRLVVTFSLLCFVAIFVTLEVKMSERERERNIELASLASESFKASYSA